MTTINQDLVRNIEQCTAAEKATLVAAFGTACSNNSITDSGVKEHFEGRLGLAADGTACVFVVVAGSTHVLGRNAWVALADWTPNTPVSLS